MILDQFKKSWKLLKNHIKSQEHKSVRHSADDGYVLPNSQGSYPVQGREWVGDSSTKPQCYSQKMLNTQAAVSVRCGRVPGIFSASDVHRRHNPYLGG